MRLKKTHQQIRYDNRYVRLLSPSYIVFSNLKLFELKSESHIQNFYSSVVTCIHVYLVMFYCNRIIFDILVPCINRLVNET